MNLVESAAAEILDAYSDWDGRFRAITQRARGRFEGRDWHGSQRDAAERLDLYPEVVTTAVDQMGARLGGSIEDRSMWAGMKAAYSDLILGRHDCELAETFFNSITRRIFSTVGLDAEIEFIDSDFDAIPGRDEEPVYRTHRGGRDIAEIIESILADYHFAYEDPAADASLVAAELAEHLDAVGALRTIERIEMVESVFYRGKRAYLIGRVHSGLQLVPMAIVVVNTHRGVLVDAVLLEESDVSILFSFTRSYFQVAVSCPAKLVAFLTSLMPRKRPAELYIAIGYNKHGKTGLYRALQEHLDASDGQFEVAAGVPGLVMVAFTMPGYDMIFKVLRDSFEFPKKITRSAVIGKYGLVFKHDRAGRLVEAQEFEHLQFDRSRFTSELLEELQTKAGRTVVVEGDRVIVNHCYVERRLIPLNIYVRQASERAAQAAVIDYGNCIKDLAKSNIFPGDMLLKNFGVTRHSRVVFYDYDELTLLTGCRFRRLPAAESPEEEMAVHPWFGVGDRDIFPEEFPSFLGLPPGLRRVFEEHHSDLYDADFWTGYQDRIESGEIIEIVSYPATKRFWRSGEEPAVAS